MLDIKWKKSERSLYGYILAYVFFLACIVTAALSVNSMITYHDTATGFNYAQCGIAPNDTSGMLTLLDRFLFYFDKPKTPLTSFQIAIEKFKFMYQRNSQLPISREGNSASKEPTSTDSGLVKSKSSSELNL